MRILMLGNSLTMYNQMLELLAKLLGAEVVVHARGGARLSEQLNPVTKLGGLTAKALREEKFDYVVLQEMSHGPATATERYLYCVGRLAELARGIGAVPLIYGTWAFHPGCEKLQRIGMDTEEMHERMQEGFRKASIATGMRIANAGQAFKERGFADELYAPDGQHPSRYGSTIAAEVIAKA